MLGFKKKKEWKWFDTATIFLLCFIIVVQAVVMFIVSVYVTDMADYCAYKVYEELPEDFIVPANITTNISSCANLTIFDASQCLAEEFRQIWTYNITNDYEYDNFTEVDGYIRQYGGDCHESSVWFMEAGRDLGYYTSYVPLIMSENETEDAVYRQLHAFTIISSDEGYCILDQGVIVRCLMFENNTLKFTEFEDSIFTLK